MDVENYIHLKTVHFNTKNAILAGAKDTNSHTADLEGKIIQKIKNGYCSLLNKQQLKSTKKIRKFFSTIKKKYVDIFSTIKKKKISDRHGVWFNYN